MKKAIYSSLALGAVLALSSCASDEPLINNQNDGSLSFTVSLPGQNTRFAEGTTVDKLYYSVFDTEGNLVLQNNQAWPAGSLTTTVTLQLVANYSYDIVFFADNSEAEGKGYSYNAETAQFSVTYGQEMVNNDIFDAFVKNEKGVVADGNAKSVTLTRPFAQLNIGTNDLTNAAVAKYGLSNFSSTLSIAKENVLSGINFLNGTTTTQTEDLSFAIPDFSTLPEDAFPVSGYSYIEMNYLLVAPTEGETANLINATYTINGKAAATVNTLNLASTPVRQNYRTNIYGSLLTTQNNFNVEINPAFEGGWNNGMTVVNNTEDFHAALVAGKQIYVAEGTSIDMSTLPSTPTNGSAVTRYDKPVTLIVDGTLTNIKNPLAFEQGLTLTGNGTLEFDMSSAPDNGIETGAPSSYQTFGDVKIEGVTIKGVNQPSKDTYGNSLVNIRNPKSLSLTNVTVENPVGSGLQFDCDSDVRISGCRFISNYGDNASNDNPYVALIPYGNAKFTFDDCEIVGPMGIWSAAGNAGGNNASVNYTMIFNGGAVVSTEREFNMESGPLGMGAIFGNGSVTFNGTYIYSDNDCLICMTPFFRSINATFVNCIINDGQIYEIGEDGSLVSVTEGYDFSAITPEIKTFAGKSYTFTKKLNGTHLFEVK